MTAVRWTSAPEKEESTGTTTELSVIYHLSNSFFIVMVLRKILKCVQFDSIKYIAESAYKVSGK